MERVQIEGDGGVNIEVSVAFIVAQVIFELRVGVHLRTRLIVSLASLLVILLIVGLVAYRHQRNLDRDEMRQIFPGLACRIGSMKATPELKSGASFPVVRQSIIALEQLPPPQHN